MTLCVPPNTHTVTSHSFLLPALGFQDIDIFSAFPAGMQPLSGRHAKDVPKEMQCSAIRCDVMQCKGEGRGMGVSEDIIEIEIEIEMLGN